MARILLLADSNFSNNIGEFRGRKIKDLVLKSCQSRKVLMDELAAVTEGVVVISCLDMLAADVAKTSTTDPDSAVEFYYNQLLFKLVDMVDSADNKLAVGIAAPIFWTTHSRAVKRSMNHAFKTLKQMTLSNIWFSDFWRDINAGADGTHLTRTSANYYIERTFDFVQKTAQLAGLGPILFEDEGSDPTGAQSTSWADDNPVTNDPDAVMVLAPPEDMDQASPTRTASIRSVSMLNASFNLQQRSQAPIRAPTGERLLDLAHGSTLARMHNFTVPPPGFSHARQLEQNPWGSNDVGSSLARIERRLGSLEAKVFYNNVMTASLKEEQDCEANKAMLSKVTISGVPMPGLSKLNEQEKIQAIKDKAAEIVDLVKEEGQSYKVVFVRHLNKKIRGAEKAVLEVKLESNEQAAGIRASFVKKQKEKDPDLPAKMNISPVVRLSTRVRVEILHSIANLLVRHDPSIIKAMCLQYIPKPVIKIIRKAAGGNEFARTMTFIEAVCWVEENGYSGSINLSKAHERAGATFRGILAQTFVLLHPTSSF